MRMLYTDGTNSAWHIALGALHDPMVAVMFTMYQVCTDFAAGKLDFFVDMLEFATGWFLREL